MRKHIIETPRLYLCKIEESDYENLANLFSDPDIIKYSINGPYSKEKTRTILDNMLKDQSEKDLGSFAVFEKNTNIWIGLIGAAFLEKNKISLIYRFYKKFWNKGYASESLSAALEFISMKFPNLSIWAYIEKENIASIKVATKANMKFIENTIFHNIPVQAYKY